MRSQQLTDDGLALVLLTTPLALPRQSEGQPKPLTLSEWASIAQRLLDVGSRPADLLGQDASNIEQVLQTDSDLGERIAFLLARGTQVAIELERLSSRGIWVLTRTDEDYPPKLKRRLGTGAPTVLFGSGSWKLLSKSGVAVVGSREVDDAGLEFAGQLGSRCGEAGLAVYSGGARGVDRTAMMAALEAGGVAVGILAESLERAIQSRDYVKHLLADRLTLATQFLPNAPFMVSHAMARNRVVYCLANAAVVVASSVENGGTRAGALENLKHDWVPLFVRSAPNTPPGNAWLLEKGAKPLDAVPSADTFAQYLQRGAGPDLTPRVKGTISTDSHQPLPELSANPASPKEVSGQEVETPVDFFHANWPRLAALLDVPKTEAELALLVDNLLPSQLRAWLKRAVGERLVERRGRPQRYTLASTSEQSATLEPNGTDAGVDRRHSRSVDREQLSLFSPARR